MMFFLYFLALVSLCICICSFYVGKKIGNFTLLGINSLSFIIFVIVLSYKDPSTVYVSAHVIVTAVVNIVVFYIMSELSKFKDYEASLDKDDKISFIRCGYVKQSLNYKFVIIGFVAVTIILSSFLGYSCYKAYKSNSEITSLKSEINTYKSDIKLCNEKIDTLEIRVEARDEALSISESLRSNLKREIKMYEKVTGNTKGFVFITKTGNKFHLEDCHYLKNSSYFIMYSVAVKRRYTPCSNCLPNGY